MLIGKTEKVGVTAAKSGLVKLLQLSSIFTYPAGLRNKGVRIIKVLL